MAERVIGGVLDEEAEDEVAGGGVGPVLVWREAERLFGGERDELLRGVVVFLVRFEVGDAAF